MGGLFPERTTLAGISRILEVGCGPGSWSLDVSRSYPSCSVVGIDCSPTMIGYAQSLKDLHGLPNVHFERMSSDERLRFESQRFDLITLHWNISSLFSTDWTQLLQECVQVARPMGTIRIIEEDLLGQTNCDAHTRFSQFCIRLRQQKIGSMALDEGRGGRIPTSEALLHNIGCETVSQRCCPIDVSFGKEGYEEYAQYLHLILLQTMPLLGAFATQDELEQLLLQVLEDLKDESFKGCCEIVIRWGEISGKD